MSTCPVCGRPRPTASTPAPADPPLPGTPRWCLVDHQPPAWSSLDPVTRGWLVAIGLAAVVCVILIGLATAAVAAGTLLA